MQQEVAEVDNRDVETAQWIMNWGAYVVELGAALFGKALGTLVNSVFCVFVQESGAEWRGDLQKKAKTTARQSVTENRNACSD